MTKTDETSVKTQPESASAAGSAAGSPMNAEIVQSFHMLVENKEFMFKFMEFFPFPIEVFAPDGLAMYVNRAMLEFCNIPDINFLVGKYNVLKDPVMEQMGLKDNIQKAFRGEVVVCYDINPPIDDLVRRGLVEEKPFEKAYTDWYFYPIMDDKKLLCLVFVCSVKKVYHDKTELTLAKEYMDTHWQGEYYAEAVAKAANMSVTQLYKIFKQHTGMTPGAYYKRCKIERIKEKLLDKNLSVKEAFAACGEDSRGWILRVFKYITSMTPTEFRRRNLS